jgi:hypothetical protein
VVPAGLVGDVELFERIELPPIWHLRWTLANGVLNAHLREEDGEALAEETVKAMSITEDVDLNW